MCLPLESVNLDDYAELWKLEWEWTPKIFEAFKKKLQTYTPCFVNIQYTWHTIEDLIIHLYVYLYRVFPEYGFLI